MPVCNWATNFCDNIQQVALSFGQMTVKYALSLYSKSNELQIMIVLYLKNGNNNECVFYSPKLTFHECQHCGDDNSGWV